jgi:hypothetical protein
LTHISFISFICTFTITLLMTLYVYDTVRVEPDDQDPRPTPEQSPLLTLDCVFARGLGLAYRSPTK